MHFIQEHVSGAQIIFGLDWSPIIGGQAERLAEQRARAMGATHYVLAGSSHGCAAGIVRLQEAGKKTGASLHSAAAMFSKSFPHGAQACLMTMKEGACWMLVCHAGAVLSHTDRWFADISQALEAIEPIRQRFPSLQVQRESLSDNLDWPVWLSANLTGDSVLKCIRYSRFKAQRWLYPIIFILLPLAATTYHMLNEKDLVTEAGSVSIENLWRQALREQSKHTVWHAYSQLKSVMDSWMKIPVRPLGWRLTKVQCESIGLGWNCSARFVRQHRLSLNSHLEQLKPLGWRIDFSPLEDAAFVWQVDAGVRTLDLEHPWRSMDWMSYLQRLSVAYEHIQVGQITAFPVKAPLDNRGQALTKLAIFPAWTQRTLVFKGPLRSFSGLEDFAMPVRWRRLVLNIDRQAMHSINRSALTFELIGDMFESTAQ